MTITTLSRQEFNRNANRAQKAAQNGPVFITDHGHPAHVLLTIQEYQRITGGSICVSGWWRKVTVYDHSLLPAKYDQLVTVETKFDYIKRASIRFSSYIWDEDGKKLLVEGYTIHACTNMEGKIRRIPQLLLDLTNKFNINKGE